MLTHPRLFVESVDILPELLAGALAPAKDFREGLVGKRDDVFRESPGVVLEIAPSHAVDHPGINRHAGLIEGLEDHAVGMERKLGVRAPNHVHFAARECLDDRPIGTVTL